MSNTSAPLAVAVDPDPLVLERVVTARRLGTYKLKSTYSYGTVQNGENGHGENGNGGNGHNGENGGSIGTLTQNPSSSQTGLAALSLGFMGGRQQPSGPLFADNPWGESETAPAQDPAAYSAQDPSTSFDPVNSDPATQDNQSSAASAQAPTDVAGLIANLGQATSPWQTPATQSPFATSDPFSSGVQAAQNMFANAAAAPSADPIPLSPQSQSGQFDKFDPSSTAPAPPAMPQNFPDAPQQQQSDNSADPFAFDGQMSASTASGSFFDEPTANVKPDQINVVSDNGFDAAPENFALAPAPQGSFEAATPVEALPVEPASAADLPVPVSEGEPETVTAQSVDSNKTPDNNFAHTAAIAAAAAIAGAAAGAAAANAVHARTAGGDFFDAGPPAPRKDTTSGDTEEAGFDPFSPAASKTASSQPTAEGAPIDDFFSAAPIGRPKREDGSIEDVQDAAKSAMDAFSFDSGNKARGDSDDAFGDESAKRGKKDLSSNSSDSDAEARPKIARPRGFSPSKDAGKSADSADKSDKSAKSDKTDSADDDFFAGKKNKKEVDAESDEDAADKEDPPPRKSFSGGASTIKRPGAKKKEIVREKPKKGKDEDKDDDEDANLPFFEREISIGGMSLTNKSAVILGTICAFMTVVVFNTFCTFCTYLAGSMPKGGQNGSGGGLLGGLSQPQTVDISGIYNVFYKTPMERNGGSFKMQLGQQGTNIYGRGEDAGGPWILQGNLVAPNKIQFKKFYLRDGKPFGKGIQYAGEVGVTQLGRPFMQGQLAYETKMGKFWRATIAQVTGSWKAVQTVPGAVLASQPGGGPQPPAMNQMGQMGAMPAPPGAGNNPLAMLAPHDTRNPTDMSGFFMKVAFGLIGIGVLMAMVALFIFGPSGKLNIMAKQEYIPSQYKSQHNKMMREWSKPFKRGAMPLGTRVEWRFWKPWVPRVMAMPPESRTNNPHMIIMGGSDKGKSRMMANMICHDIESNDRAIIVIDSDGELADIVTNWVAAHQKGKELSKRIIIIDPTYRGGSMSYNPLEPLDDINFIDAASAIVHGFKAIYTEPPGSQSQWNQQTANILRNSAILLMANNKTLIDLPTLLQDNDFRDILLEGVEKKKKERTEYTTLIETWGQYKRLARTDQWINWVEPILNRVTPMLSDPRIRPILTKPVGDLRLHDLIVNKQVLLVRIPQGQLDQNGNLLGSLLVTGLKQAALSLAVHEPDKQQPCALYLDEMNNFIEKETIEALTQETDKFKIGFVGCCKTLQHLPEDFRNQIIINVGTVCAFALAKKDGDMIGPQMFRVDGRKIKHRTIQNFFNQVNTSPQFELISDEEKLNIDRVVGQETRDFFCYRVGTVAGTFSLKTHDFPDIPKAKIKKQLLEQMHTGAHLNKKSTDAA